MIPGNNENKKPVMAVYGDGVHDDTEALQEWLSGKANLIHPDGRSFLSLATPGRTYLIGKCLSVHRNIKVTHVNGNSR